MEIVHVFKERKISTTWRQPLDHGLDVHFCSPQTMNRDSIKFFPEIVHFSPILFAICYLLLREKRIICGEKWIEVKQYGFGLWTRPLEASHYVERP